MKTSAALLSLILIADDNPHAHRMGRQILSQEGHHVVTVSDGDEALLYLAENRPDLVLADTRMPGPNGFEICRHVKTTESLSEVKVVLLAGPLEPFDPAQAESAGCDSVLHKPLDAGSLIETVNSLIGKPEPQTLDDESPAPLASDRTAHADDHRPEPQLEQPPQDPFSEERGAPREGSDSAASRSLQQPAISLAAAEDPFAALVQQALGVREVEAGERERVRAAVQEALEASLPALTDSLTDRVLERLHAAPGD